MGVKIKDIDTLIEKANNYNSYEKFLNELASLLIPLLNLQNEKITYHILLKKELAQNKKRLIAFCMLRVYSVNSSVLTSPQVKHNINSLIEQALPDVLKSLKITSKTETWKKENLYESYVKNIEKNISEKISIDIDIQELKSFKNTYLSTINNSKNKSLIFSFFDEKNIKDITEKALNYTIKYVESNNVEKFSIYQQACEKIDNCIETAKNIGTKYSKEYIEIPFSIIKKKLEDDFNENPFSKDAKLTIDKTEKKYPIYSGISNNIRLIISNSSTGYAYDTLVEINDATNVEILQKNIYVGTVKTHTEIEIKYKAIKDADDFIIEGILQWKNYNDKYLKNDFIIELKGQRKDIDWEKIENEEPYDLEPVTTEREFIGRRIIINELKKVNRKIKSSYVFGQRRVGKTSIVKTLQSSLNDENILVMYFEAGDWNNASSPQESMNDLGRKICSKIIRYNKKFNSLNIPEFKGSFNKITDFLDEVSEIDNDFKSLIILDEFDRISSELLSQGDIAKSFMLTIRSISNREQYGFILVGGEKLEYILSQWQEFNKFKPIRVDYFDKQTEWDDFKDLIKFPVKGILEISDKAIDYIYSQTSGNPYFTKKICIELFSLMVSNRDNHVTKEEILKATKIALDNNKIGATDFSHFWKDGIKEKEEKEEQISIHRRKVLLAIGQIIKNNLKSTKDLIIDKSIENGLSELEAQKTLEEFIQRKIIKVENKIYSFVVKFFQDWLINSGLEKIITTFEEEQKLILRKKYEEEQRVKHNELVSVTQSWPTYRGEKISTEKIREWIEQFDGIEEQRLIFNLVKNIKFYSNVEIREKMENLFTETIKEINKSGKYREIKEGQRKRNDIIVSYLDNSPAKSGPEYNKIFTEVNNIYKDNSTIPEKIVKLSEELKNINALVFIDDFIGTGDSMIENIENKLLPIKDLLMEKKILIIIGIITGFQEAKYKIEKYCNKENIPVIIKLLDPLDDRNKCFSDNSLIYKNYIEREKAKQLCYKIGSKLEKNHPLGYGNCQGLVVFPNNCPNNTLPIIWKEVKNWKSLFRRY